MNGQLNAPLLPQWKQPPYEVEWAPEPFWTFLRKGKSLKPTGF